MLPNSTAGTTIFRNAAVLDVAADRILRGRAVVVQRDRIQWLGADSELPDREGHARVIDLRGMTLMPGLIDAHVHVTAISADLGSVPTMSPTYVAARSSHLLGAILRRGFTTVRDCGGCDHGLAEAVEEGWFEGPRLIFGGKALSQTGGHADYRERGVDAQDFCSCRVSTGRVVDGEAEVRRACRDEIRRGAHHIKLMLSGGVSSPTDRIDSTQFSTGEILAAVEEAEAAGVYVAGHAYTAAAVNRAVLAGVRTIEHGNLIDATSVALMKERDAFYVPTLATYAALAERGRDFGLSEASHRKVYQVLDSGLSALRMAHEAGVAIAYGTDLLGGMQDDQSTEFRIRAAVQRPIEVLQSATVVGARLLGMEGQLGVIAEGAIADLLVLDGDPRSDIDLLAGGERHLQMVMKAGQLLVEREGR